MKQQKFTESFKCATEGLKIAWAEEFNFKVEMISAIMVLILSVKLGLSGTELAIVILAIFFVLTVEALNTSLEELCDKFQPTHDPHIAKIKDLAAAAVLLSSMGSIAIGIIIFTPYLLK